ncbi:MAG: hypothetical protein NT003_04500, partial [Candidatus Magasanikbacteria bacterium]|nr:hypothetical protein [Candidatus Magasanikbacteria bacterium]
MPKKIKALKKSPVKKAKVVVKKVQVKKPAPKTVLKQKPVVAAKPAKQKEIRGTKPAAVIQRPIPTEPEVFNLKAPTEERLEELVTKGRKRGFITETEVLF